MSFFGFFRKTDPIDVLRDLRQSLVISALTFRTTLNEPNDQKSSNAAAELLFLLLHLADISMFTLLGPKKRDLYFDHLTLEAIRDYSAASLKQETPEDIKSAIANVLLQRFNSRQVTYAKCKSMMGDQFPGAGSTVFAFSFFVFRALDQTSREDVDEVLAGNARVTEADQKDFPPARTILKNAIFIGSTAKEVDIARYVRKLR
jgi:hypothetical protein